MRLKITKKTHQKLRALARTNSQALKRVSFSKSQLLIFVLVFGGIGGYVLLSSHAATAGANLWVDTDGGSCTRSATPAVYDTTTACGSLDAAFAASLDGDTVLVKCGTYPVQTISTIRTSGNVTFKSETNKCATFEANGAQVITIGNKVGYLTLDSVTINGRIVFSSYTGTGNNNVTISNNDIDVGKKVNGQPITYYVGSNLKIIGNTIGPSCCGYNGGSGNSPEAIRIGKPNADTANCQSQACDVTIADNLIQYAVRDCQYWPSSGYGACPDTTCTNAIGCHMDGIHIWGMDGGNITGNRLYGVECQGIYFENTNNSLQRNVNIVNNAISTITGGCSNKGIYLAAQGSVSTDHGFAGTWNIAFNSGSTYLMGPNACGSCQTGTVFNVVGNNMELDVVDNTGNDAGCGSTVWGAATVNFKYNVWRPGGNGSTNQACGAADILASPAPAFVKEVVPPDIGIDLHLASGSSAANDFVPSAVCTAITTVDFDGDARPQGPACDAGADEYVPTADVWVSTTGDDSTCARGDSTKPCATFDKAYHLAQQGDVIEIAGGIYPDQAITNDVSKTSANGNCRLTYNGNGTFNEDRSGCVTFQPAQGSTVTIGCKTTTTADVDLTTQTTIPVVSTNNCPLDPGQSYYWVRMSGSTGGIYCTGKDATNFTGCTPHSIPCYSGSGSRSGSQECHWYPGADVQIGSISVQASYVRVRDITISRSFSVQNKTNPVSDVIADGLTTSTSFWDGSYLFFENGLTGDTNDLGTSMYFSNTDHSGVYHSTNRNDTNIGMYNEGDYYNHPSNLYMNGNTNWYYVGNRNYNGQGSGLLFMSYNATYNPGPVTIVNNYFGKPYPGSTHTVTIDVGNGSSYPLSGYTIMGNSSVGLWDISDASTANINSSLVTGNIGVGWPCTGGGTYDVTIEYNVDSGTACSSTSSPIANHNLGGVSVASLWTDASINNLDLAGGPYSWEDQWVSCPLAVDINGNSRPATCTAGADEPSSISPLTPGDLNSDGHVNITDLSIMLSHYGNSATPTQGDLNSDGQCTITDLSILLSHYGN